MKETNRNAIAEIVMHGRKSIALVRPFENLLAMSILCYDGELKDYAEFQGEAPAIEVNPEELKLAKTLMDTLAIDEIDMASYHDDYTDKLRDLVEAKIAGKQVVEQPAEEAPPIINLMEALQKSIATSKKSAGAKPAKMVAPGTAGKAKEAARKRKSS